MKGKPLRITPTSDTLPQEENVSHSEQDRIEEKDHSQNEADCSRCKEDESDFGVVGEEAVNPGKHFLRSSGSTGVSSMLVLGVVAQILIESPKAIL